MTDLEAYELERRLKSLADNDVIVMNGKQFRDFMGREQARGERTAFMAMLFVSGGLEGHPTNPILTTFDQVRTWCRMQLEGARAKVRILEAKTVGQGGGA